MDLETELSGLFNVKRTAPKDGAKVDLETEISGISGGNKSAKNKSRLMLFSMLEERLYAYRTVLTAAIIMSFGAYTGSLLAPFVAAALMINHFWHHFKLKSLGVRYKIVLPVSLIIAYIVTYPVSGLNAGVHIGEGITAFALWIQVLRGMKSEHRESLRLAILKTRGN